MTITTEELPETTAGGLPPAVRAARPVDADTLRLFLAWGRESVWPGASPLPWSAPASAVQAWPCDWDQALHDPTGDGPAPGTPEGAAAAAVRLLGTLASAAVCGSVLGGDVAPADHINQPAAWALLRVHVNGHEVRLPSWDFLRGTTDPARPYDEIEDGGVDPTAALWRWSAADRAAADGRRTARDRTRALADLLPAALMTAQAMHDALAVLLPEAAATAAQTPTAPTPRRNQWR